jgi:serine/threonine protein kinase
MKIEDLPTFDLAKIEFLEKLGEGKNAKSYSIGAFGKVRLCKIIKGGGFQGGSSGNKSAPLKASAVFKGANQTAST